jgi:hypothetical protein
MKQHRKGQKIAREIAHFEAIQEKSVMSTTYIPREPRTKEEIEELTGWTYWEKPEGRSTSRGFESNGNYIQADFIHGKVVEFERFGVNSVEDFVEALDLVNEHDPEFEEVYNSLHDVSEIRILDDPEDFV